MKGVGQKDQILFNIKDDLKNFTDKKGGLLKYLGECFYNAAVSREKKMKE
jgi:hypothetical protein